MGRQLFLGVDGGATKTEVALVDRDGTFLAGIIGGPTQLEEKASEWIIENINSLIDFVCEKAGATRADIAASGFGLHGVDYQCELEQQRESLFEPLGLRSETSVLVNDGIVALWGGTSKKRAAVLQIGSGFTAAYRDGYGTELHFDPFNMGLGINLRDQIYAFAFRSLDGRERRSILPELLYEHFEIYDTEDLIRRWRRNQIDVMSVLSVVSVLTEAVARGDRVTLKLTRRAAAVYAHDVLTMLKKIGPGAADVVLGGGVLLNGPPLLLEWIAANVNKKRPDASVHRPYMRPALGGCVLAAHRAGEPAAKVFARARKTGGAMPS